jgi:methylmalonyl-CoA mutase N-terminal domain/subunit
VHRIPDEDDTMLRDLSEQRIDPSWEQIDRIAAWKVQRDRRRVSRALDALLEATADEGTNLMPAFVEALNAGASLGESTGVMRLAYGAAYDPVAGQERTL